MKDWLQCVIRGTEQPESELLGENIPHWTFNIAV